MKSFSSFPMNAPLPFCYRRVTVSLFENADRTCPNRASSSIAVFFLQMFTDTVRERGADIVLRKEGVTTTRGAVPWLLIVVRLLGLLGLLAGHRVDSLR